MFDPLFSSDKPGGRSTGISLLLHAVAIFLVFLAGGPVTHFVARPHSLTLIAPTPPPRRIARVLVTPPARMPVARRAAITPVTAPKIPLPSIPLPQAPVIEPTRTVIPSPALPQTVTTFAPPVKTGEFSQSLPASVKPLPHPAVESSGFSAAEEIRPATPRGQLTTTAGFESAGLASASPKHAGISSSGFASSSPASSGAQTRPSVTKAGFGDASREAPSSPGIRPSGPPSPETPVEILSKPRPVYSSEARALGIEGEVLVEVVFEATGNIRIVRIVKGLGHGLDENALTAAREIRFRPAQREGFAADSMATIHIVFQLAN